MNDLCNTRPTLLSAVQELEQQAKDKYTARNAELYADLVSVTDVVAALLYTLNGCTSTEYMEVYFGGKRTINMYYLFQHVEDLTGVRICDDHQEHPEFTTWFNTIAEEALGIKYRKCIGGFWDGYNVRWENETFKEYMYYKYWCCIDFKNPVTYMLSALYLMAFFITIPCTILIFVADLIDNREYIEWGSKRKTIRKNYGC